MTYLTPPTTPNDAQLIAWAREAGMIESTLPAATELRILKDAWFALGPSIRLHTAEALPVVQAEQGGN